MAVQSSTVCEIPFSFFTYPLSLLFMNLSFPSSLSIFLLISSFFSLFYQSLILFRVFLPRLSVLSIPFSFSLSISLPLSAFLLLFNNISLVCFQFSYSSLSLSLLFINLLFSFPHSIFLFLSRLFINHSFFLF